MAPLLSFRKSERLVSRKLIEQLFAEGQSHSVVAFPLRAVYTSVETPDDGIPVQIVISVPKKRFHHAVDRNRVKRQVREAYRHSKHILPPQTGKRLLIAFIWIGEHHVSSDVIAAKTLQLLTKINERTQPAEQ